MKFYDLHVQYSKEAVEMAKKLELTGICLVSTPENFESNTAKIQELQTDIEIFHGIEIKADTLEEMKKLVEKYRNKCMIIIAYGGSYAINRAACENPLVDILAHPELGRYDNGLDEACIRAAKENNVAIEINFREVLYNYRKMRTYILNKLQTNIMLCQELSVPLILCSGAKGQWDMRDPRQLVALANILGADLPIAFAGVSEVPIHILEKNKKRLLGKLIGKGVELV